MRIGIDARFYGTLGKGLGRYVSELISHLERVDKENEYVVFLRRENFNDYQPKAPNFSKVEAEFPWYGWREQLIYPFWLKKFELDLMHFGHFNVPLLYRGPFVVTIHDLILLSHPTQRATTLSPLLYRLKYWLYRLVIKRAILTSQRVITVSEFSKQEILKRFPEVDSGKVVVTYEACADALETTPGKEASDKARSVSGFRPFALYVGSAYPHKNLGLLLKSFAKFRERGHSDWKLVLVGKDDYFYSRLKKEAQAAELSAGVVFFGRASEAELANLYDAATFYVFPSLCEGFGLPPLEAMSHDLPVAAARASCLPEVLEGAAYWFDPNNADDLTTGLSRLADDEELRRQLIELGRQQVSKYSWKRCTEQTLGIYREALAKLER